jgi:hypothetical protein
MEITRQLRCGEHSDLGWTSSGQGRLEEAETFLDEVFETRRKLHDDKHPETLTVIFTQGSLDSWNRQGLGER